MMRALVGFALVIVLLSGLAAACSRGSKPQATPEPKATATPAETLRLNHCPPGVGDDICTFAAKAQDIVQQDKAASLIAAGGALDSPAARESLADDIASAFADSAGEAPTLRSIACPMVRDTPPRPDCTQRFALIFATVPLAEISTASRGTLVLGFERTAAGIELNAHGLPTGPDTVFLFFGPMAGGADLPGVDPQSGGLGHRVYPVEVLAPGETPSPAPGSDEVIQGIPVNPLRIGAEADLPDDLVVYLAPVRWATDSGPSLLLREYRAADGTVRRDDLFANAANQLGPLAIVGWAGDETMQRIIAVACQEGRCRGTGVGGWAGEFDVVESLDGGMTWAFNGRVPALAFPMAVTFERAIFGQFLSRDDNGLPTYRFFLQPEDTDVAPPATNTEPRTVPGLGIIWEPAYRDRTIGPEPSFDATGKVIPASVIGSLQARLVARWENGGIFASWSYTPDRPADPHPPTNYIGRVDPSGQLSAIFSNEVVVPWLGPFAINHRYLIANAEVKPPSGNQTLFDVPAVLIDLATGFVSPLRELNAGLEPAFQPIVRGAVPGRVARVVDSETCLNVREAPTVGSPTLGCFPDGVLLAERGESTTAEGITWIAVSAPSGKPGWASAEFLERRPD